jgi:hypothetical protein
MKALLFVFALALGAQTKLSPPQMGVTGDVTPTLFAVVGNDFVKVEIGTGFTLTKMSSGSYLLRVTVPTAPTPSTAPPSYRLTRLPNGNYPACPGKIERNGIGAYDWNNDYTVAANGEIVTTWPASDTVACVPNGSVAPQVRVLP